MALVRLCWGETTMQLEPRVRGTLPASPPARPPGHHSHVSGPRLANTTKLLYINLHLHMYLSLASANMHDFYSFIIIFLDKCISSLIHIF